MLVYNAVDLCLQGIWLAESLYESDNCGVIRIFEVCRWRIMGGEHTTLLGTGAEGQGARCDIVDPDSLGSVSEEIQYPVALGWVDAHVLEPGEECERIDCIEL